MTTETKSLPRSINPALLAEQLESGRQLRLLDVRTPGEFRRAHLADSSNVPLSALHDHASELGAAGEPIVVICRSGARARTAESILRDAGVRDVHILDGGVLAWQSAGKPVERSEGAFSWSGRRTAGVLALALALGAALWREQPILTLLLAIAGVRMLFDQPALPCMGGGCRP